MRREGKLLGIAELQKACEEGRRSRVFVLVLNFVTTFCVHKTGRKLKTHEICGLKKINNYLKYV